MLAHIATKGYCFWINDHLPWSDLFVTPIALCLIAHAALSVSIVFFAHDGSALAHYAHLNRRTCLQRASALVFIVCLHFHAAAVEAVKIPGWEQWPCLLVELLFLAAAFTHIATSLSKALVTLGAFRSDAALARTDRTVCAACAVLFAGSAFVFSRWALVNFILV